MYLDVNTCRNIDRVVLHLYWNYFIFIIMTNLIYMSIIFIVYVVCTLSLLSMYLDVNICRDIGKGTAPLLE